MFDLKLKYCVTCGCVGGQQDTYFVCELQFITSCWYPNRNTLSVAFKGALCNLGEDI